MTHSSQYQSETWDAVLHGNPGASAHPAAPLQFPLIDTKSTDWAKALARPLVGRLYERTGLAIDVAVPMARRMTYREYRLEQDTPMILFRVDSGVRARPFLLVFQQSLLAALAGMMVVDGRRPRSLGAAEALRAGFFDALNAHDPSFACRCQRTGSDPYRLGFSDDQRSVCVVGFDLSFDAIQGRAQIVHVT